MLNYYINYAHFLSMNKYAYMLQNGISIEKNLKETVRYYKISADEDDVQYAYMIQNAQYGNILFNGIGLPVNHNEGFKCFKKAAEKGHSVGLCGMGYMMKEGFGT